MLARTNEYFWRWRGLDRCFNTEPPNRSLIADKASFSSRICFVAQKQNLPFQSSPTITGFSVALSTLGAATNSNDFLTKQSETIDKSFRCAGHPGM